jgi:hypothetical protein
MLNELSQNLRQNNTVFPPEYVVADELQYDYRIHLIIKTYGVAYAEACEFTEEDFAKMIYFENIESARKNYLRSLYKQNQSAGEY